MIRVYKVVNSSLRDLENLTSETDLLKLMSTDNIGKLADFSNITQASEFASSFPLYNQYYTTKSDNIFIYQYPRYHIVLIKD